MKIAQIAPIIESVPPKMYGGTERVISALTEELVKRGHQVTLFASGDSLTRARLSSVYPISLREANVENLYGHNIWSLLNVGLAYQEQEKFDIIHDHNSQNNPVSLPLANLVKTPVVMTLHGPLTHGYYKSFEFYKKPYLVTISKKQAVPAPYLNYIGNVYHGLSMNHYPFSREDNGYLLFVGRIRIENGVEVKGLHHAISVAKRIGMPLLIAAKIDSAPEDKAYFQHVIKPQLSKQIIWIGEVDELERNRLMHKAYCLLHTVNFAEPFGLTLIEAMASGCPVVAFNKGSIPEVILNSKTGYVVEDEDEMVEAIKKIRAIDRFFCRLYALEHFSAGRMADDYEKIYTKVLEYSESTYVSVTATNLKTTPGSIHPIIKPLMKQ
jgi:glycosyltransferase involved in cell wall biosynthesis